MTRRFRPALLPLGLGLACAASSCNAWPGNEDPCGQQNFPFCVSKPELLELFEGDGGAADPGVSTAEESSSCPDDCVFARRYVEARSGKPILDFYQPTQDRGQECCYFVVGITCRGTISREEEQRRAEERRRVCLDD